MTPVSHATPETTPRWLSLVRAKVDRLRFGVVQLVVYEGRVTQIECTEKTRLSADQVDPVTD